MAELISVGLDVGTTTTQLILSRLQVENRASGFAVPQMEITNREIVYRSEVIFTPLKSQQRVDGDAIRNWVAGEYEKAGIRQENVDTGAIIITGETSRKENASQVLNALSSFAGEFVVATAGPDLESVLAAKGAGAVEISKKQAEPVLHIDIGGGTSNFALLRDGRVLRTGCMNVGGRLVKFEQAGKVSYISPVLEGLTDLQVGDYPTEGQVEAIAKILVQGLEMGAGLRPATSLLEKLWTKECGPVWQIPQGKLTVSFSGGVADCIEKPLGRSFGDMGPVLGQAIRQSLLCQGDYRLGEETIRATVIGAGCHSTTLSGSTVFYKDPGLPLKNLPVAVFSPEEQESIELSKIIRERIQRSDAEKLVLHLPGYPSPSYSQVQSLAQKIGQAVESRELYLCLQHDMAKALGQAICLIKPNLAHCLCMDGLSLTEGSYLDVGEPVGPALPVVIKTLILSKEG